MNLRRALFHVIDIGRKTDSLKLLPSLHESQWYAKKKLEVIQNTRLRNLIQYVYSYVPYYRELLKKLGLTPEDFKSKEDLVKFSIVNKNSISKNKEYFKSDISNKLGLREKHTSASTGEPFLYYIDRNYHSFASASIIRAWNIAGYNIGDRYVILGGSALFVSNKSRLKQKIYDWLRHAIFLPCENLTDEKMERYLNIIKRFKSKFIYGYPSTIYLLAKYIEKSGMGPPDLQAIFTTSEMLYPDQRVFIERIFCCKIFDQYGCNDGGIIAFECEKHNGFHYAMEGVILEIVDEKGNLLENGKMGRIIATSLLNYAMPFIRYDTGDLGVLSNIECKCRRGLGLIERLGGRSRDYIITPEGKYFHGSFFNQIVYQYHWIERYQVIQSQKEHLTLKIIPKHSISHTEIEELKLLLKKFMGNKIKIDAKLTDKIMLTKAGKFKVIISNVD